jgi:hypothetical protein
MVMIVVMRNKLMMLFMALGMIEIFGGPTTAVVMVQVWRCRMRVCVRMQMLRRLVGVRLPEHWRQQCRSAPSTLVAVASVAGSAAAGWEGVDYADARIVLLSHLLLTFIVAVATVVVGLREGVVWVGVGSKTANARGGIRPLP